MDDSNLPRRFIRDSEGKFTLNPAFKEVTTKEGEPAQYPHPVHPNDVVDPCILVHQRAMEIFKNSYPNPFIGDENRSSRNWDQWGDVPRCRLELRMCELSASIRDKKAWQEKMKNPEIMAKWRHEALNQPFPERRSAYVPEWRLDAGMVDYVLEELDGYAKLIDADTGIEVACYERIWKSDALVPASLRQRLLDAVFALEDVPELEKDWHPGSNGQVLDLVHPSLYPVVYERTQERNTTQAIRAEIPSYRAFSDAETQFYSHKYTWLPSDFHISDDGTACLAQGTYINNLHPEHHVELYQVIDELVTLAVLMFERVLSDLKRPLSKQRMITEVEIRPHKQGHELVPGTWDSVYMAEPWGILGAPDNMEKDPNWTEEETEEWFRNLPKKFPEALPKYDGALDVVKKKVSLKGGDIQIIVKLANIVLTPENPSYPGGNWHVKGKYYDEFNITESRLKFRTSTVEPMYDGQDDCMHYHELRYGARSHMPGSLYLLPEYIPTQVRFGDQTPPPKVLPFQLSDPTKPGYRKILAFFLINPDRRIPSTSTVAPQQYEWIADAVRSSGISERLPAELIDDILEYVQMFTFTSEEAQGFRKELMEERSTLVQKHNTEMFHVGFNMCMAEAMLTALSSEH
ncbi:hypothetical protein BDZ89DRAFT_1042723 [Hymenopellis radicata]|nr:hypothetical protein BDZ89DRAFT_1042723 [Hymenopellis radicata]